MILLNVASGELKALRLSGVVHVVKRCSPETRFPRLGQVFVSPRRELKVTWASWIWNLQSWQHVLPCSLAVNKSVLPAAARLRLQEAFLDWSEQEIHPRRKHTCSQRLVFRGLSIIGQPSILRCLKTMHLVMHLLIAGTSLSHNRWLSQLHHQCITLFTIARLKWYSRWSMYHPPLRQVGLVVWSIYVCMCVY
jgi:hypothetical protein